MTGALGGVLLGARQDRFVYEFAVFSHSGTTISAGVETYFNVTDSANRKAGEAVNYLGFMLANGAANTNSMTRFEYDGVLANYYRDHVADQTDEEFAAIGVGVQYIDDADYDKTAGVTWANSVNGNVKGYYRFYGGRGNVTVPTYIERQNTLYPQTHSGISVQKDDVVVVLMAARSTTDNSTSATNLSEDYYLHVGEMNFAAYSTQITEDGTFSTTINVLNEQQQYCHILMVIRKGD